LEDDFEVPGVSIVDELAFAILGRTKREIKGCGDGVGAEGVIGRRRLTFTSDVQDAVRV
jgi:hypothetical protein